MKDLMVNGELVTQDSLTQEMINLNLPLYMADGVFYYLIHHLQPGRFLMNILSNDLRGAVQEADDFNGMRLKEWVQFMYNYFPSESWGSEKKVQEWLAQREVNDDTSKN